MDNTLTLDELVAELRKQTVEHGGVPKFAAYHNIAQNYVYQTLRGDADPGPKIQEVMGVRRVHLYEKVQPND